MKHYLKTAEGGLILADAWKTVVLVLPEVEKRATKVELVCVETKMLIKRGSCIKVGSPDGQWGRVLYSMH